MDRFMVLIHHLLGLPGMLAIIVVLVIARNVFGTVCSVLFHKEI